MTKLGGDESRGGIHRQTDMHTKCVIFLPLFLPSEAGSP